VASSNRTIVGLKPKERSGCPHIIERSNRTIVGLKQVLPRHHITSPLLQQSHHCGIETATVRSSQLSALRSNRTIVGLKLAARHWRIVTQIGSNRTIVGLKPRF